MTLTVLKNYIDSSGVSTVSDEQSLADGQTVVIFDLPSIASAGFYICGDSADNGRLCDEDYTVDNEAQITLAQSYPAGTIVQALLNEPVGSDITDDQVVFDNVNLMTLSGVGIGQLVETKGYYVAGDGGQASYLIEAFATTPDGFGDHLLTNGNVAVLQITDGIANVKQYGATGDGVTDDQPPFQAACNANNSIYSPNDYSYMLKSYVELNSGQRLDLHGTIIQKGFPDPSAALYHIGGFDAELKDNIRIFGTAELTSELIMNQASEGFQIHQAVGYCPLIHIRACSNVEVSGLTINKATMGIAFGITDKASQPNFNLIPLPDGAVCSTVHAINCRFTYLSFFGTTLNTVRTGSIDSCYCYRCGDSGLHAQFSKDIRIINNHRESPYGDGSDVLDLESINDAQGISIENCQYVICSGNYIKGLATNGIDVKNNSNNVLVSNNFIKDSQLSALNSRGGDLVIGFMTNIIFQDNVIKNCGYLHTSNSDWVNHPYKGAVYIQNTYSVVVRGNTFIGLNSDYATAPVVAIGVTLDDLGFWSGSSVEDRVSYTEIVVDSNTVSFPEFRSNYTDDPTGFESSDCNLYGVRITGIWGKIQVNNNSLLGNGFAGDRFSTDVGQAAISIHPDGATSGGEVASQSVQCVGNTVSYWNGGGIFVNAESSAEPINMTIDISSNIISHLPGYGIACVASQTQSITGNTINSVGQVAGSIWRYGIYLSGSQWGVISSNTIRSRGGAASYEYALSFVNTSVTLLANMYQQGSLGDIGGSGSSYGLGGNDVPAGTYNGTNYRLNPI